MMGYNTTAIVSYITFNRATIVYKSSTKRWIPRVDNA